MIEEYVMTGVFSSPNSVLDPPIDQDIADEIKMRIDKWLQQGAKLPVIADWLEGYGLPPLLPDEEPHVWLARGIERCEQDVADRFVGRFALFLNSFHEMSWHADQQPDRILHNALQLCASLARPAELAGPLLGILDRGIGSSGWEGRLHADTLRVAITYNQLDERFKIDWYALLNRKSAGRFVGTPTDGFTGLCQMPDWLEATPTDELVQAFDRLADAVKELSSVFLIVLRNIERSPQRGAVLRSFIHRLTQRHPEVAGTDERMIRLAEQWNWPAWGVLELPRLVSACAGADQSFLAWEGALRLTLPTDRFDDATSLCRAQVLELKKSPKRTAVQDLRLVDQWRIDPDISQVVRLIKKILRQPQTVSILMELQSMKVFAFRLTYLRGLPGFPKVPSRLVVTRADGSERKEVVVPANAIDAVEEHELDPLDRDPPTMQDTDAMRKLLPVELLLEVR